MRSSRHVRVSLVAVVALCVAALGSRPAVAAPRLPLPIGLVRLLPLGTTVTVVGSVTVPSGAFDAGFAMQDLIDGIYVLDPGGAARHLGDRVAVTGVLV